MKSHELKTWVGPFEAIWAKQKHHEIRENDRDFKVGDQLILREFDAHAECDGKGFMWVGEHFVQKTKQACCPPPHGTYTEREVVMKVTYMTKGGEWGLPEELCVMSI